MKKNNFIFLATVFLLTALYLINWNINEKNYLSEKNKCIDSAKKRMEETEKADLGEHNAGFVVKWKYSKSNQICYYVEQTTIFGTNNQLIVSKYIYNLETNQTLFMSVVVESENRVIAGLSKEKIEEIEKQIFDSR